MRSPGVRTNGCVYGENICVFVDSRSQPLWFERQRGVGAVIFGRHDVSLAVELCRPHWDSPPSPRGRCGSASPSAISAFARLHAWVFCDRVLIAGDAGTNTKPLVRSCRREAWLARPGAPSHPRAPVSQGPAASLYRSTQTATQCREEMDGLPTPLHEVPQHLLGGPPSTPSRPGRGFHWRPLSPSSVMRILAAGQTASLRFCPRG